MPALWRAFHLVTSMAGPCDRGPTEHSTSWYALSIAFSDAEPRRLRQFEILAVNVPYHMPPCQIPPPQPSRAEEVRLPLEENPKRRLFPYAVLDDKYGMLLEDEYENQASFLGEMTRKVRRG